MTYVTDSEHAQVKNFHKTLEEKSKRLQDPNESENSQRILEKEKYYVKMERIHKSLRTNPRVTNSNVYTARH